MKPLILIAIAGFWLGSAQAEFFEKSPVARLDLQFEQDAPNFYTVLIWLGPEISPISLSGELEKVSADSYREKIPDGTSGNAPLALQKDGENWRASFGTETKPPYATAVSGVYSPVSNQTAAQHAKMRFEDLDALLNTNYQAVRKSLIEARSKELRGLQRDWISYRDRMAADQPRQNGEGDGPVEEAPSYWDMKVDLTQDRLAFLDAWSGKLASPGITGTYRDFLGGAMTLRETETGLEFTLDVVRGPTFHTGEISGVAVLKGDKAAYSDQETPPAKISWNFKPNGRVEVTAENDDQYHGARAYFQGEYFKTSSDVPEPTD